MGAGGFLQQREEALHPAINGAAIDDEAAFSEPFHDIRIAQAVPHVPADGQRDHIVGETMFGEGACRAGREASTAIVGAPALSAQARLSVLACLLALAPNALHHHPRLRALKAIILLPSWPQQNLLYH